MQTVALDRFGDLAVRRRYDHGTARLSTSREQMRSEEHTSELQSHVNLVCRLLLEKKKIERVKPLSAVDRRKEGRWHSLWPRSGWSSSSRIKYRRRFRLSCVVQALQSRSGKPCTPH